LPIEFVGEKNTKLSLEENDILSNYLKNFIKSNKLKVSTNKQREEEVMLRKLKDFLV